jgi:hypothetical protein
MKYPTAVAISSMAVIVFGRVSAFAPSPIARGGDCHVQSTKVTTRTKRDLLYTFGKVQHKTPTPSRRNTNRVTVNTRLFLTIQDQEDLLLEQAVQNVVAPKPDIIYIIMYNPGTDQEGVHTTEYPKESGSEVMIGFESIEDCINFSNMLKSDPAFQLEPVPTPTPYGQMDAACAGMGLSIMVVPEQQQ